jgi:hypothetical protein
MLASCAEQNHEGSESRKRTHYRIVLKVRVLDWMELDTASLELGMTAVALSFSQLDLGIMPLGRRPLSVRVVSPPPSISPCFFLPGMGVLQTETLLLLPAPLSRSLETRLSTCKLSVDRERGRKPSKQRR